MVLPFPLLQRGKGITRKYKRRDSAIGTRAVGQTWRPEELASYLRVTSGTQWLFIKKCENDFHISALFVVNQHHVPYCMNS